jgi:hypothetical protein
LIPKEASGLVDRLYTEEAFGLVDRLFTKEASGLLGNSMPFSLLSLFSHQFSIP